MIDIKAIPYKDALRWITKYHYAKRKCNIMNSFGMYVDDVLSGVVTYGMPPSPTLCRSICGEDYSSNVIELNRLITLDNLPKNYLSMFVSKSIKMIDGNNIIVSFADANQNHSGYIYQATNFLYTGLSSNTSKLVDKFGNEFHFRNIGHYQKNNKLNVKLVKRRKDSFSVDKSKFVDYLKNNKGHYTYKKIDSVFGYKDTASHWFRKDSGHSFPSIEDYPKLKYLLSLDDTYDEAMTDFRLVPCPDEIKKALDLKKIPIKPKHRYVFFSGSKKWRRRAIKNLKLSILEYPKGQNENYDIDFSEESYRLF